MPSLAEDVVASLNIAARNSKALEAGLEKLRRAVAVREWAKIEAIRAEMLAAVDGYIDNYVAAARRVEHQRSILGR